MDWNWPTWLISVAAVIASGAIAWREGHWARRPGLAMGFVNHGGMWGDLLLLPMANAAIAPHLDAGWWIAGAVTVSTVASIWVHIHWYRPPSPADSSCGSGEAGAVPESRSWSFGENVAVRGRDGGDHMWPTHTRGSWWGDLSWSGWAHVAYVVGELTLLIGFLVHQVPNDVVLFVAAIFTIHVPIGLLQPRWYRTGHIATIQEQPLLAPLLMALWAVMMVKL